MTVSGATLALVIAATAAVSAHPGDRGDRGERGMRDMRGKAGIGAEMGPRNMPGVRGGMGGPLRGGLDEFQRQEVTIQTADGVATRRVEQGVVESAADDGLSFALGSGEAVTVTIDDETSIVALEEQTVERGGWSRQRMVPTEVELADIEAGAQIVVWSDSEDGGDFVASRVVVQPADDAEASEAEPQDATEEDSGEIATDDAAAATTDA